MKQNKYDDPELFAIYSQMPRSVRGLEAAAEWPVLRSLLPDLRNKRLLDLGCGFGWHCRYARERQARRVVEYAEAVPQQKTAFSFRLLLPLRTKPLFRGDPLLTMTFIMLARPHLRVAGCCRNISQARSKNAVTSGASSTSAFAIIEKTIQRPESVSR